MFKQNKKPSPWNSARKVTSVGKSWMFLRQPKRILNGALRNRLQTRLCMSIFGDKKALVFFACLLFGDLSAQHLSIRVAIPLGNDKNSFLTF